MAKYARSSKAPDTQYFQFKIVREKKGGLGSKSAIDKDVGYSPISRWLAFALQHSDFTSNPNAVGHMVELQIPRGTLVKECMARVDTLFAATGANDIDIGDSDVSDGWADGHDWSSTGWKRTHDAAYNNKAAALAQDSTGPQFYQGGGIIRVLFKNATAPTAGKAIVFLETISYHEDYNSEW